MPVNERYEINTPVLGEIDRLCEVRGIQGTLQAARRIELFRQAMAQYDRCLNRQVDGRLRIGERILPFPMGDTFDPKVFQDLLVRPFSVWNYVALKWTDGRPTTLTVVYSDKAHGRLCHIRQITGCSTNAAVLRNALMLLHVLTDLEEDL